MFRGGLIRFVIIAGPLATAGTHTAAQETRPVTIRIEARDLGLWGRRVLPPEELRIGSVDPPGGLRMSLVSAVALSPDGSILVFDHVEQALALFDDRGALLGRFGRTGAGPGEFRSGVAVAFARDGSVLLWDPTNRRIAWYEVTGEVRRMIGVNSGLHMAESLIVGDSGDLYVKSSVWGADRRGLRTGLLHLDSLGVIADTMRPPLTAAEWAEPERAIFAPRTYWARSADYRWAVGSSGSYRVRVHEAGHPTVIIERRSDRVEVRREERAYLTRVTRGQWAVLDRKPAFRNLWFDADGRLWVRVHARARAVPAGGEARDAEWLEPATYQVYSSDYAYLGEIELPLRTVMGAASGDRLLAIQTDADGQQSLVRYRLPASPR